MVLFAVGLPIMKEPFVVVPAEKSWTGERRQSAAASPKRIEQCPIFEFEKKSYQL